MLKKIVIAIAAGLLVAIGMTGIFLWTPSAPAPSKADLIKASKAYSARIIRDKWGVPHIFGARDADAAFGLAYAHASDDWETIQTTVLFARGTLAVHRGKSAAATDYLVALMGVWPAIEAKYETDLSPRTRALAEGYAAGINLWAAEHMDRVAAGVVPVTGKDVVAGFAARTPFFYGLDSDLKDLFADAAKHPVSKKDLASLWPFETSDGPERIGSNAMAVAPSRAADGHTRLMVNSHQPWTGPVAWYEAHMVSDEGWNVLGGLFPGAPMVLHGVTPDLGWAFTVNRPDLADIYKLKVDDPRHPTKYMFDGQWRAFKTGKAKFRVKLFGPFSMPVSRDVLRSVQGPAVVTKHGVYAIRYAGTGDIRAIEQWRRMNRATTMAEWRKAFEIQGIPNFNVVFADKKGDIGFLYNAAFPDRAEGWNWRQYLPGDTSDTLWTKTLPVARDPQVWNPQSGFVISSNATPFKVTGAADDPDPSEFSKTMGIETNLSNRAIRALKLYGGDAAITSDAFKAYKFDKVFSPESDQRKALDPVLALDFSGEPELASAQAILRGWDGDTNKENTAAALAVITMQRLVGYASSPSGETPEQAFRSTVADLTKHYGKADVPWGDVLRLKHGRANLPLGGAPGVLRSIHTGYELDADGQLAGEGGDSYILYADWDADGNLTAQSIHQFGAATLDKTSPHYADQAPLFADEEFKPMPMTLDGVLAEAESDIRIGGSSASQ